MALALWQLQIAQQEERNILKIRRRQLRDASNPFEILESQFLLLYRQVKKYSTIYKHIGFTYIIELMR